MPPWPSKGDRRIDPDDALRRAAYRGARRRYGEELSEPVVERLESGGTTLAESLALWERGEQLAATCQRWLDGARQRLEAARGVEPPQLQAARRRRCVLADPTII